MVSAKPKAALATRLFSPGEGHFSSTLKTSSNYASTQALGIPKLASTSQVAAKTREVQKPKRDEIIIMYKGKAIFTSKVAISIVVDDVNDKAALRALDEARKLCPLIS